MKTTDHTEKYCLKDMFFHLKFKVFSGEIFSGKKACGGSGLHCLLNDIETALKLFFFFKSQPVIVIIPL